MVFRVDPTTTDVQKFPLRQSADVLVFGDGSVWVLDTLDGKIARVDPSKGQLGPSFLASGDLHGMAVGGGYLWVTDASTNGIQRISEDLGSPLLGCRLARSAVGPNPSHTMMVRSWSASRVGPSRKSTPRTRHLRQQSGHKRLASSITVDRSTVLMAGGPLAHLVALPPP